MNLTTVQDKPDTGEVEVPDRAQMLRIVAEAIAGGLPAPQSFNLFLHSTGTRSLNLRMDDNRAEDVDAWVRAVSPDGEASALLGHTLYRGGTRSWRSYNYDMGRDVSWHGWVLTVWSAVDEPEYPAPGSEIPDQAGYVVGECEHRVAFSEWRAGFRTCERCQFGASA